MHPNRIFRRRFGQTDGVPHTPRPNTSLPFPFPVTDPARGGIGARSAACAAAMTDHAATTTRFVPVPNLDAFDDLLPRAGVVVLFLHAPRCGISVRAYAEVALGGEVALIDVARDHDVKRAVADRTGVRHASPQVIVLRGGAAVWSAALADVTAAGVAAAVREHA